MNNLHKEFVRLGRERNKITYKLLALLPKIYESQVFEQEGYANIYDYAAKIAGLSPGVVKKVLKIENKLKGMPHLQKTVETQGIHKVGIVAGLATKENEEELADKVENMSKAALQEYSKENRGNVTVKWQVELDKEMMHMFLKLKKQLGKNLNNKECLRKILECMLNGSADQEKVNHLKQEEDQGQEKDNPKRKQKLSPNPSPRQFIIPGEKVNGITRYIPVKVKRQLGDKCTYPCCHRPAEVIHHPQRFSEEANHNNLKSLCKLHHEFAHNGVSEQMRLSDFQYRRIRMESLC